MIGFTLKHVFNRIKCEFVWTWVKNGIILPNLVVVPAVCGPPPHSPPGNHLPPTPPVEIERGRDGGGGQWHKFTPPGPFGYPGGPFAPGQLDYHPGLQRIIRVDEPRDKGLDDCPPIDIVTPPSKPHNDVPEPSSLLILATAGAVITVLSRRKKPVTFL